MLKAGIGKVGTMERNRLFNPSDFTRGDGSWLWRCAVLTLLMSLSACDFLVDRNASQEPLIRIEVESAHSVRWASLAVRGDQRAFAELARTDRAIAESVATLEKLHSPEATQWNQTNNWIKMRAAVKRVLVAQACFERDRAHEAQLQGSLPKLQARLMHLAEAESRAADPDARRLLALMQVVALLERVRSRLPAALFGGDDATSAFDSMARDFSHVEETLGKLRRVELSAPMRSNKGQVGLQEELDGIIEEFGTQVAALEGLLENSVDRFDAVDALGSIESEADQLAGFATLARRFAR